ncbi:hypothetical protein V492_03694 [Pseudogymnoascus sp. VKM F-4246]|nr:hypothetical protein V492_03694 [Pseudogymnoascus sp. VKM F-4246]
MPVSSTDQLKSTEPKHNPFKLAASRIRAALSSRSTGKGTEAGGSTKAPTSTAAEPEGHLTHPAADPILNAALLDGSAHQHFLAGRSMSKNLAIPCLQATRLLQGLVRYSNSIIRNPKDRFDGRLPDIFDPVKRVRTEQIWREMTGAELEEAGFAYGEDIEILEMQGVQLMGWVAEDNEVSEAMELTESV